MLRIVPQYKPKIHCFPTGVSSVVKDFASIVFVVIGSFCSFTIDSRYYHHGWRELQEDEECCRGEEKACWREGKASIAELQLRNLNQMVISRLGHSPRWRCVALSLSSTAQIHYARLTVIDLATVLLTRRLEPLHRKCSKVANLKKTTAAVCFFWRALLTLSWSMDTAIPTDFQHLTSAMQLTSPMRIREATISRMLIPLSKRSIALLTTTICPVVIVAHSQGGAAALAPSVYLLLLVLFGQCSTFRK